jgi:2-amino-4-hydroxy-6-hydroxymethyldihydropteridine diphosphokinase
VYLGLGSNLGRRHEWLAGALTRLQADSRFMLLRRAGVYRSRAQGEGAGGEFLNTAVSGVWNDEPEALLDLCQSIETALGRTRPYRYAPRTLDIDLLWWEGRRIQTGRLQVPHPRLLERAFALVPLLDINPELVMPESGEPLSTYLTAELLDQGIELYSARVDDSEPARV